MFQERQQLRVFVQKPILNTLKKERNLISAAITQAILTIIIMITTVEMIKASETETKKISQPETKSKREQSDENNTD